MMTDAGSEASGSKIADAGSEASGSKTTDAGSDVSGSNFPVPGPLSEPLRYGVYTGLELEMQSPDAVPAAAQLGLEPPRYCGQCGRRMVVQVRPHGWDAKCSRHGVVDSTELGQR